MKIKLFFIIILFYVSSVSALVIPPNTNYYVFPPFPLITDSLTISGTLCFANLPGHPPDYNFFCFIVITNGNFILADGGVITQIYDYADSLSKNGTNGVDGTADSFNGTGGGLGDGFGFGGRGGNGYSPIISEVSPSDSTGGDGGTGGNGGCLGGNGGNGGRGGDGMSLDSGSTGGTVGNGGAGGAGGNGGSDTNHYFRYIVIHNTTPGGIIDISKGTICLSGPGGGNGGKGGDGGNGGDELSMSGGLPGDGATGANGGNGGNGYNGPNFFVYCSNGFIFTSLTNFDLSGGNGGDGGNGGNGGDGGIGGTGEMGNGGDGGNGGNAGNGGRGGSFYFNAAKIYTNNFRNFSNFTIGLDNGGLPGTNGFGGNPGTGGNPGMPGMPGNIVPNKNETGEFYSHPDLFPPAYAVKDPVISPENQAELMPGIAFLIFDYSVFSDNMTSSNYLRHTIQIVPTNDPAGTALATIATNIYNNPQNTNIVFAADSSWIDFYDTLFFRFITKDMADFETTNLYPAQTSHIFTVVPEPILFFIIPLILIFRRKY